MTGTTSDRVPILRRLLWPAAILLLTLCAYLPALRAGYIWDDDFHVTENHLLRSTDGLLLMWFDPYALPQYYPMTHTTFWVEYQLWRLRPLGYHLDNVLLHAANAVLLGLLLARLRLRAAWWVAAVFAVHPVHAESVAWVSERKNVLSGLFYLLAFHSYERFQAPRDEAATAPWRWYALSLVLFAAALFSKTVTATLPGALLLVTWWKRGRVGWKDVALTLPYFVGGMVMAAVTAHVEHVKLTGGEPEFDLSLVERLLIAGRAAWFYAGKLLWPVDLAFIYRRWNIDARQLWQFAFPLAAGALILLAWLGRHRLGRGPLVAILFFGGTLSPALGFVNVWPMRFSFVADHFQYLASIGILALAVEGVAHAASHARVRTAAFASVVALLGVATFNRSFAFRSAERIWHDTLAKNPTSWLAHVHLAGIAQARGDASLASHHYEQTLRLRPRASTHVNYGIMLMAAGRNDEAREQLLAALRMDPSHAVGHNAMGVLWTKTQNWTEAAAEFAAAANADPNFADARNNLGMVMERLNRPAEARDHYLDALRANPHHAGAAANLARLAAQQRGG